MSNLHTALNKTARTANGALTNYSSVSSCLDFFYLIGSSRNEDITSSFKAALVESRELALRILLWGRDIREGAGERLTFRKLYTWLGLSNNSTIKEYAAITYKIPELGRWDDVLYCSLEYRPLIFDIISDALKNDHNHLCAKWMPRKGYIASELRRHMRLTPKEYRKLLVTLSNTVEQKMCSGNWDKINYEHVPSVASARYQAAFMKHDVEGYSSYREKLCSKTAKINAGAIFPHDVIKAWGNGDKVVSEAQWDSLPNYLEDRVGGSILPVVDVSGSMGCLEDPDTTPLHIAIALGLYISERNNGGFKDEFITFSENPVMIKLRGSLGDKIDQLNTAEWEMNTNFNAVFELILNSALKNKLQAEDLPDTILVLSDMEFDESSETDTHFEAIKVKYSQYGYKMPQIVFWNLCSRKGNIPVTINDDGVALISGFSPSILKSVLGGNLNPRQVMLDTVMKDRYSI